MKRTIIFGLIGVCLGVLVGGMIPNPQPAPKPQVIVKEPEIDLNPIIAWVYKHSSKISKKTARIIVEETFQNSKYPLLLLAIFAKESSFNPTAVSKKNAFGLGQILVTKEQIKLLKENNIISEPRDLFDIETNIKASEFMLDQKLKSAKGDLHKALYLYVGGNKKYAQDVLQLLGDLYLKSEVGCKKVLDKKD